MYCFFLKQVVIEHSFFYSVHSCKSTHTHTLVKDTDPRIQEHIMCVGETIVGNTVPFPDRLIRGTRRKLMSLSQTCLPVAHSISVSLSLSISLSLPHSLYIYISSFLSFLQSPLISLSLAPALSYILTLLDPSLSLVISRLSFFCHFLYFPPFISLSCFSQ